MADPSGTISYDVTFSGGAAEEAFYIGKTGEIVVTVGTLAVEPIELRNLFDRLTQWLLEHKMATMTVTLNP